MVLYRLRKTQQGLGPLRVMCSSSSQARTDARGCFSITLPGSEIPAGAAGYSARTPKIKNSDGEFRDWSGAKKLALTIEFSNLVAETTTAGAVANLVRDDFNNYYRADASQSAKVRKDSGLRPLLSHVPRRLSPRDRKRLPL